MATSSSMLNLAGPTYCLLTGASQGIGRALAVEVSRVLGRNSVMLLLARNKQHLMQTVSLCNTKDVEVMCESVDLSVATPNEIKDIIEKSLKGRNVSDFTASLIFHNVGSLGNLAVETSLMENNEEWKQYFNLNVFNVITLNTQYLKVFKEVEDRIVIVNITSLCAIKPMTGMAYYCSGKAAREMYFKVLAEEKKNIRILNYSPGPVKTAMIDYVLEEAVNDHLKEVFNSFKSQGVLLKPEMTAKKCLKVLMGNKYTSGDHIDYFDDE